MTLRKAQILSAMRALFAKLTSNEKLARKLTLEYEKGAPKGQRALVFKVNGYWVAMLTRAADHGLSIEDFTKRYLDPAALSLAEHQTPRSVARVQMLREMHGLAE